MMTMIESAAPRRRSELIAAGSLALVALAAWAPALLAPDALYWDDWANANGGTVELYTDAGLPLTGYLTAALFSVGPYAFKVLSLVATVFIGWAVFRIAGAGFGLGRFERWVLAALVVALPLNTARVSLAVVCIYALSLAAFTGAWLLLVRRAPLRVGPAAALAAAVLLILSYSTASLLVFTVLPLAHLAWIEVQAGGSLRAVAGRTVGRTWFVVAAPVGFWIARALFFRPRGLYAQYNGFVSFLPPFTAAAVLSAAVIAMIGAGVIAVLVWWRGRSAVARMLPPLVLCVLGLLSAALLFLSGRPGSAPTITIAALVLVASVAAAVGAMRAERARAVMPVLAVGLLVLLLGAMPYLLVGKAPTFTNWDSRNQLLLPFGVAIIVLAALRALAGRSVRVAAAVVVAISTMVSFGVSLTLVSDWRVQSQVIAALAADPQVRAARIVVFADEATSVEYDARPHAFYEYTAWLRSAFDQESRLGLDRSGVGDYLDGRLDGFIEDGARYGLSDFSPSADTNSDAVQVTIETLPGVSVLGLVFGQPGIRLDVEHLDDLASLS